MLKPAMGRWADSCTLHFSELWHGKGTWQLCLSETVHVQNVAFQIQGSLANIINLFQAIIKLLPAQNPLCWPCR